MPKFILRGFHRAPVGARHIIGTWEIEAPDPREALRSLLATDKIPTEFKKDWEQIGVEVRAAEPEVEEQKAKPPVAVEPNEDGSSGQLTVGGTGINWFSLAADLTKLGVPTKPPRVVACADSVDDFQGWISLIGSAKDWLAILGAFGLTKEVLSTFGELAELPAKFEGIRKRIAAALGPKDVFTVSAVIPFPGQERSGAEIKLSLAPDAFVDDLKMFYERVAGIDRALSDIYDEGDLPYGSAECLLSEHGFRVRWRTARAFAKKEADFAVDGERRGPNREGWSDVPGFSAT